jgi:hypothetical protein
LDSNAQTRRYRASDDKQSKGRLTKPSGAASTALAGNRSRVVESAGDVPWTEFCKLLNRPAFLLAVTGFGEL